ncbi:hypothetical protein [Archangium violaceum]|uniref:Uncharacterized protein n=1 Tax=Archangium violaceum Cb vi76 TaxID=1406225 RepID=A0A084SZH2_9BACT|nr:hypothetical protein [Archangium violaceum]KFA93857.1 hypothetical protein Q664_06730 [Archangium violaceum Cb vi76]
MPAFQVALEKRGLKPTARVERDSKLGQAVRGLVRFGEDSLSGLRYADVLVIEEGGLGGGPRRVETFSFKSRNLSGLKYDELKAQLVTDAKEALTKYGETLRIRRDSLQRILPEGSEVPIQRVRLVYEGGELKPENANDLRSAVNETRKEVPGVEVLFR